MDEIIEKLIKFRDDRNWKQFHTPENLAKSVAIEAGELLEHYQWENKTVDINGVKEEIADVVSYCLLLCEHYGFDLKEIIEEKIIKNGEKYPIEKAYGNSKKYDKL